MRRAIIPVLFCFVFCGCLTGGMYGSSAKVDSENIFHSYTIPKMQIRVAKDIKYINTDEEDYKVGTGAGDDLPGEIPSKKRTYNFVNPYDPDMECIKIVRIEFNYLSSNRGWAPITFENIPGLIEHGFTTLDGDDYQYGIILNNYPLTQISNNSLKEAYSKIGHSGPIKIINKIFYQTMGSMGGISLMISYSESIPKTIEWHTSSVLTDEQKNFLEAFRKRCEQNLVISN